MHTDKSQLRLITEKSMSKLSKEDIVLPSKYLKTFMDEKQHMEEQPEKVTDYEKEVQALKRMEYRLLGTGSQDQLQIEDLITDVRSLRKQLFSDDLTHARNRLWFFKQKLQEDGTFSDSGLIVKSIFIDHASILKEYGPTISDTLTRQISEYMTGYMREHHLAHEIVRFTDDSFLVFLSGIEPEKAEHEMLNLHKGMEENTFRHKNRVFKLKFLFAVMKYLRNEPFSMVMDQLDEKLFEKGL